MWCRKNSTNRSTTRSSRRAPLTWARKAVAAARAWDLRPSRGYRSSRPTTHARPTGLEDVAPPESQRRTRRGRRHRRHARGRAHSRRGPVWTSRPSSSTTTAKSEYSTSRYVTPRLVTTLTLPPARRQAVRPLDVMQVTPFEHRHRARGHVVEDRKEQAPTSQSTLAPTAAVVQSGRCRHPLLAGVGQRRRRPWPRQHRRRRRRAAPRPAAGAAARDGRCTAALEVMSAGHDHPAQVERPAGLRRPPPGRGSRATRPRVISRSSQDAAATSTAADLRPCARSAESPASDSRPVEAARRPRLAASRSAARCGRRRHRDGPRQLPVGATSRSRSLSSRPHSRACVLEITPSCA